MPASTPTQPNHTDQPRRPACATTRELLPWLVNGSLGSEEEVEARQHLESCDGCRDELRQVVLADRLLRQHVPARDLSLVALGEAPELLTTAEIEAHVAGCASCREELEIVQQAIIEGSEPVEADPVEAKGRILPFRSFRKTRPSMPAAGSAPARTAGLWLAMAAALLLAVGLGWTRMGSGDVEVGNAGHQIATMSAASTQSSDGRIAPTVFANGFESSEDIRWAGSPRSNEVAVSTDCDGDCSLSSLDFESARPHVVVGGQSDT